MILAYSLLLQLLPLDAYEEQVIKYAKVFTGSEVTREVLLNDYYEYITEYEKQINRDYPGNSDNDRNVAAVEGLKPYVRRLIDEANVSPGDTCFLNYWSSSIEEIHGRWLTLIVDSTSYTASYGVPGVSVKAIPGINTRLLRRWDDYTNFVYEAKPNRDLDTDPYWVVTTRAVIKGDSIVFDTKSFWQMQWVSAEEDAAFREEYGEARLKRAEAKQKLYEATLAEKLKENGMEPTKADEQTDETAAVADQGDSDGEQPSLFRRIIDWIVGFFKRLFS